MAEGSQRTIHAFLLTEDNEFQRAQADAARAAASRLGLNIEVRFAESNAQVQIHQLFDTIHGRSGPRPDAIVVETTTSDGLPRVARNAASAGIGWAVLNAAAAYLGELREQHPELPILGVRVDNLRAGELQGQQVLRLLGDARDRAVLCVQGPLHSAVAQERFRGLKEVLAPAGVQLASVDADWTVDSAHASVRSWLRLGKGGLDLVVAQNDEMAAGAREAVRGQLGAEALERIPFLGCDGLPQGGQALVRSGALAATLVTGMPSAHAVEALAAFFARKALPPEEVRIAPESLPPLHELRAR